jgi:xanthine dehydrogenase accessory factor
MEHLGKYLVVVKGAGDLASGVIARLHRVGFPVIATETAQPTVIRRTVSFAQAVYDGQTTVEDLTAQRVDPSEVEATLARGIIPILTDPQATCVQRFHPAVVVDAIIAKRNLGTRITDAPLVIALGPGFTAGVDAHAVIETNRGHYLGRVLHVGTAAPNTGIPGEIAGHGADRVLRAPAAGVFHAVRTIGDTVAVGDVVAMVDDQPVTTPLAGVLRGLLHDGLSVPVGMKVGDVDPRAAPEHCFTISDKALAIAGGVLEAVLTGLEAESQQRRQAPQL